MEAARRLLPPGQEIIVYKNNSDGKGNSYGCHENYLVDRTIPFAALVRTLVPWFVTRTMTPSTISGKPPMAPAL